MARITLEEVKHVAHLARLEFSQKELESFKDQLDAILEFVAKLEDLDTEGVEPTNHAIEIFNCFREDKVKESLEIKDVMKNAPQGEEGSFVVPRII